MNLSYAPIFQWAEKDEWIHIYVYQYINKTCGLNEMKIHEMMPQM